MTAATELTLGSILDGVDSLRAEGDRNKRTTLVNDIDIPSVLAALRSFTDIVRYLNTRRSAGAILDLKNEAAVQDALYLMLRPWVLDLVPENPTDKDCQSLLDQRLCFEGE